MLKDVKLNITHWYMEQTNSINVCINSARNGMNYVILLCKFFFLYMVGVKIGKKACH